MYIYIYTYISIYIYISLIEFKRMILRNIFQRVFKARHPGCGLDRVLLIRKVIVVVVLKPSCCSSSPKATEVEAGGRGSRVGRGNRRRRVGR